MSLPPGAPRFQNEIEIAQAIQRSPGTELLFDGDLDNVGQAHHLRLKHIETKIGRLVLVPQPCDDPNDPLQWSLSKKYVTLAIGIVYSTLGAITGPLMAAGITYESPRL
jgi:hypothetical protein